MVLALANVLRQVIKVCSEFQERNPAVLSQWFTQPLDVNIADGAVIIEDLALAPLSSQLTKENK